MRRRRFPRTDIPTKVPLVGDTGTHVKARLTGHRSGTLPRTCSNVTRTTSPVTACIACCVTGSCCPWPPGRSNHSSCTFLRAGDRRTCPATAPDSGAARATWAPGASITGGCSTSAVRRTGSSATVTTPTGCTRTRAITATRCSTTRRSRSLRTSGPTVNHHFGRPQRRTASNTKVGGHRRRHRRRRTSTRYQPCPRSWPTCTTCVSAIPVYITAATANNGLTTIPCGGAVKTMKRTLRGIRFTAHPVRPHSPTAID